MGNKSINFFLVLTILAFAPLCFCYNNLNPEFYEHSCPRAQHIVKSIVEKTIAKETRMAAPLIRLLYTHTFGKGSDALDNTRKITSEKIWNPERNLARGLEVIDEIKSALEKQCPQTVSCADIIALAARDATASVGGPTWKVPLGRRDSTHASLNGSNHNVPASNDTFETILTKFKLRGLDIVDLVSLSGGHTIGKSTCASFRQRLYNQSENSKPNPTLNRNYAAQLRARCPASGGDQNLFSLEPTTPNKFDNNYFKNLLHSKGLLSSDQLLVSESRRSFKLVKKYASDNNLFFKQFAKSMIKMSNISPLTGTTGEIRKNCKKIN